MCVSISDPCCISYGHRIQGQDPEFEKKLEMKTCPQKHIKYKSVYLSYRSTCISLLTHLPLAGLHSDAVRDHTKTLCSFLMLSCFPLCGWLCITHITNGDLKKCLNLNFKNNAVARHWEKKLVIFCQVPLSCLCV